MDTNFSICLFFLIKLTAVVIDFLIGVSMYLFLHLLRKKISKTLASTYLDKHRHLEKQANILLKEKRHIAKIFSLYVLSLIRLK